MKRFLFILCALFSNITNSCNLCWNYKQKEPRLERQDISHDATCTCPCWQYSHTKGNNNFYRCIECGHRLTPPDPLSKNGPQYKIYQNGHNSIKNPIKPQKITHKPKKSNPKSIQFPITKVKKQTHR